MSHEVAKLLLEQADTFLKRTEAVKAALQTGMPLAEIEEYLDWLDMLRAGCGKTKKNDGEPGADRSDDADVTGTDR